MKYNCVVLSVADIKKARAFYEELFGLSVESDYGINIAFAGGLALQQEFDWLVNLPKDKIMKKPNNIELSFEEEDFDGFLTKVKQYPGVEFLGDVVECGWGQRVVRFYDLDGHIIEVGERMKTVVKRFLDTGMNMEETAKRMDVSAEELHRLLAK